MSVREGKCLLYIETWSNGVEFAYGSLLPLGVGITPRAESADVIQGLACTLT